MIHFLVSVNSLHVHGPAGLAILKVADINGFAMFAISAMGAVVSTVLLADTTMLLIATEGTGLAILIQWQVALVLRSVDSTQDHGLDRGAMDAISGRWCGVGLGSFGSWSVCWRRTSVLDIADSSTQGWHVVSLVNQFSGEFPKEYAGWFFNSSASLEQEVRINNTDGKQADVDTNVPTLGYILAFSL